ncbi:MAG: PIN domain-containing protein [Candidatus Woesearchaeota archaeon]
MQKYYLDTCIWRDYYENRSDKFRPLGDWAFELIKKIIKEGDLIVYSNQVERELCKAYNSEEIKEIISIVPRKLLVKIDVHKDVVREACDLSKRNSIPASDAIHVILAKRQEAILVTRDKHFYESEEFVDAKKPEELI